jgi:ABC-2 type transport system ATP-binding protein
MNRSDAQARAALPQGADVCQELLMLETEQRARFDPQATGEQAVILESVSVAFHRRRSAPFIALDQLSFAAPRGSVFCLLGPNGSGKTTTVNLIIGLLRPAAGVVRVLGLEPSKARARVLESTALVPQETALYNELTARENLLFHGRYYGVEAAHLRGRIDDVLELVQLTARQHDRVGAFSGGMQRRLALARALLGEPDLLLLDEPTLGVDVQSRQAIWDQVRLLASSGKTVLVTTNSMEEAEALADLVLILDRGVRVATGTPAELKARTGTKRLALQFADEALAQAVHARLARQYAVTHEDARLSIELASSEQALLAMQALPELLGSAGAGLVNLELAEPTLQDVFLSVTGRALRD